MTRNVITSAIALAFGVAGPAWATGSTDADISASAASLAVGAVISANKNKAEQEGLVDSPNVVYAVSGGNSISDSYNGWKGIAQNAQNSGVASLLQQNMAVQTNAGSGDVDVAAAGGALSGAADIDVAKNLAVQEGAVGQLYPYDSVLVGAVATGGNAVARAYNGWKGIAQNAQNSGVASLLQQNMALQVNEGDENGVEASADDQSEAGVLNAALAKNVASQRGGIFFNRTYDTLTGDNVVSDSHNGWKGIAQTAQNSGTHALTQQNIALQVDAGDKEAVSADADEGSAALALDLAAAKNVARQGGEVTENYDAVGITTGGNTVKDSHSRWTGLAQNAQNSGVQSLTQQNMAVQANGGDRTDVTAAADDQSGALAIGIAAVKNIADQLGYVIFNRTYGNTTGDNVVKNSHNDWKGVSQSSQMSGVQSQTQQNLALQVNAGITRVEATADDQSAGGAGALVLAKNVTGQEAALVYNGAIASVTGDNKTKYSYNGWTGLSQSAQNSGVQSMVQQNAAVQANAGGATATAAGADDESLAASIGLAFAGNITDQYGELFYNYASEADTGANTIDQSFNGGEGISQNAQNSGVQSIVQQNAAVQVNEGGQEIEVSATDASLAHALNVDLASNVATQTGIVEGAYAEGPVYTGNNSISGSFNQFAGLSQSVQNSGVQSLVQQNVAVQVNH